VFTKSAIEKTRTTTLDKRLFHQQRAQILVPLQVAAPLLFGSNGMLSCANVHRWDSQTLCKMSYPYQGSQTQYIVVVVLADSPSVMVLPPSDERSVDQKVSDVRSVSHTALRAGDVLLIRSDLLVCYFSNAIGRGHLEWFTVSLEVEDTQDVCLSMPGPSCFSLGGSFADQAVELCYREFQASPRNRPWLYFSLANSVLASSPVWRKLAVPSSLFVPSGAQVTVQLLMGMRSYQSFHGLTWSEEHERVWQQEIKHCIGLS
jgi:hypothetical protein